MPGPPDEVHGDQPVWHLCRADLGPPGRCLGRNDRAAARGRPFRPAAPRLASGAVRIFRLHDRPVLHGTYRRPLTQPMSQIEAKSPPATTEVVREAARSPDPLAPAASRRRHRPVLAVLITCAAAALAIVLGRAMWNAYMGAPWTRDGTVRSYVVTMAPEVAGRIVELPVADNQFVHKGDLLMRIDPTNYKIAVSLAEAAVRQAQANAQNVERQAQRRQRLTDLAETVEDRQTYESNAEVARAQYQQAVANLDQARVNLERTE